MLEHSISNLKKYLSNIFEPFILFLGFIYVIYWTHTAIYQDWLRISVVPIYITISILITKFVHRESLKDIMNKWGLVKKRFHIPLSYYLISTAVVMVCAVAIGDQKKDFYTFHGGLMIAPIFEEIFFRGYMYDRLRRWNEPVSIILSAFCFGILHYMSTSLTLENFISLFTVGVIYAIGYRVFRSILVPIIGHLGSNVLVYNSLGLLNVSGFPWTLFSYVLYLAVINCVVVVIYEGYKKIEEYGKSIRRCGICWRSEKDIKIVLPNVEKVFRIHNINGNEVPVCFICEKLHRIE